MSVESSCNLAGMLERRRKTKKKQKRYDTRQFHQKAENSLVQCELSENAEKKKFAFCLNRYKFQH